MLSSRPRAGAAPGEEPAPGEPEIEADDIPFN
jgi:hypothetical protein